MTAFVLIAAAAALLGDGTCGTYSPDGTKIALQRTEAGKSRVYVLERAGGRCERVEPGPGNAAFPAWHPSGEALVYTYGNETNTAWVAKDGQTGYHLRIWEKGAVREITAGRFRDSMASFSPDGGRIYFASSRCATPKVFDASRTGVYSVSPDGKGLSCLVYCPDNNMGVGQPVVSPDGTLLAFAHIANFYSPWRIVCAKLSRPEEYIPLSPAKDSAYAPRWMPDGRHIVYTGFSKGDPGWCVYILDLRTGSTRRICEGRNPDVHPSGRLLLYDDGARLWERPIGPDDLPKGYMVEVEKERRIYSEPERVLWKADNPRTPMEVPIGKDFIFGRDRTIFVRARFRHSTPAGAPRFRHLLEGRYEGAERGFQLFLDGSQPKFAIRDGDGMYLPCCLSTNLVAGIEYELTGIRTAHRLMIHIKGARYPMHTIDIDSTFPLDVPKSLGVGMTMGADSGIEKVEVGTGWPANVQVPLMRATLFSKGGAE